MIPLLVSMIIMLGMITSGIYAATESSFSLTQKRTSDEFVSEIKMIKNSVLALSTIYDETTDDDQVIKLAALPAGIPDGDFNLLPAVMKKSNVYHKDVLYCPFGAKVSDTFTAVVNGGPTVRYDVETRTMSKNGRTLDYVVGTAENNFSKNGILGVIISPNRLASEPVNCNGLVYSNETQSFTIDGGRVETITALEVEAVNLH